MIYGALDREEVCQKIREFWLAEWGSVEKKTPEEEARDLDEALLEPMRQHMHKKVVPKWTAEDRAEGLRTAFKVARGAAGVDDLNGDEGAALPGGAQEVFIKLI